MPDTWQEAYVVRSFDVDPHGRLRLASLVRALQNAADGHARRHDLALDQLLSGGITWVLSEFHCQVYRYPRFLEEILITTWASQRTGGVRAWRDYTVETTDGERLAAGTSLWLMLDTERWRPRRLTRAVLEMVNPRLSCPINVPSFRRDGSPAETVGTVDVHWLDLDGNGHVNNVRYLDWILGFLPDAQWIDWEPASISIAYAGETKPGESIEVSASTFTEGLQGFEIKKVSGSVICRAEISWRPKD